LDIAEGYIVDVAASIISYKTLYNMHCPVVPKPDEEMLYPKGVVTKALQNVAFQDALSDRAAAVIVAHNHPSGGVEPSQSDINITAQLKAAGEIVGIELLDHIIFNRTRYFSFLEEGKL
jgi:DNA repair protein RadC